MLISVATKRQSSSETTRLKRIHEYVEKVIQDMTFSHRSASLLEGRPVSNKTVDSSSRLIIPVIGVILQMYEATGSIYRNLQQCLPK